MRIAGIRALVGERALLLSL